MPSTDREPNVTDPLHGRSVVLGVTGSIAAYKALDLASKMTQSGAIVDVILTPSACRLVQPLAFQALTQRPVLVDLFAPVGQAAIDHVTFARRADLMVVAPITADTIARLALGRADDALAATALATRAPVLVAPAMEPNMWSHPATQAHAAVLRDRGVEFVGPEPGRMASGQLGLGRLSEPVLILDTIRHRLARRFGNLVGRRALVTAGPTREPLDPVRYLSNYSSGKMGLAVAMEARNRGAEVDLVHGPLEVPAVAGVARYGVETAEEMCERVLQLLPRADVLVMTAAVADYRPAERRSSKIKKTRGEISLELSRTRDILSEVASAVACEGRRVVCVGFAAETDDLEANARRKLVAKSLDLIVANPVPQTFGVDDAAAVLIDHESETRLGPLPKSQVAQAILDRVASLWATGSADEPEADGDGWPRDSADSTDPTGARP